MSEQLIAAPGTHEDVDRAALYIALNSVLKDAPDAVLDAALTAAIEARLFLEREAE